jgi:hypothetical protein
MRVSRQGYTEKNVYDAKHALFTDSCSRHFGRWGLQKDDHVMS